MDQLDILLLAGDGRGWPGLIGMWLLNNGNVEFTV